ncbi:hypothetical protein [Streptomyces sp. NBC_00996]|uniref:hypothetical protein n=1 Tax=Streptomyces sp. NBC_00996 TaxID=2903710 RepID=UPI0038683792|nr:hypothetical protein OG390_03175 [Streptomyces sp. NBC_00996]
MPVALGRQPLYQELHFVTHAVARPSSPQPWLVSDLRRVRRQSEIDKEIDKEIPGAMGKSVTDDRAPVIGGLTESRTALSGQLAFPVKGRMGAAVSHSTS